MEGVKFLWNSVFESLAQIKKCKGSGSIVAHCMGLGKTLQVLCVLNNCNTIIENNYSYNFNEVYNYFFVINTVKY